MSRNNKANFQKNPTTTKAFQKNPTTTKAFQKNPTTTKAFQKNPTTVAKDAKEPEKQSNKKAGHLPNKKKPYDLEARHGMTLEDLKSYSVQKPSVPVQKPSVPVQKPSVPMFSIIGPRKWRPFTKDALPAYMPRRSLRCEPHVIPFNYYDYYSFKIDFPSIKENLNIKCLVTADIVDIVNEPSLCRDLAYNKQFMNVIYYAEDATFYALYDQILQLLDDGTGNNRFKNEFESAIQQIFEYPYIYDYTALLDRLLTIYIHFDSIENIYECILNMFCSVDKRDLILVYNREMELLFTKNNHIISEKTILRVLKGLKGIIIDHLSNILKIHFTRGIGRFNLLETFVKIGYYEAADYIINYISNLSNKQDFITVMLNTFTIGPETACYHDTITKKLLFNKGYRAYNASYFYERYNDSFEYKFFQDINDKWICTSEYHPRNINVSNYISELLYDADDETISNLFDSLYISGIELVKGSGNRTPFTFMMLVDKMMEYRCYGMCAERQACKYFYDNEDCNDCNASDPNYCTNLCVANSHLFYDYLTYSFEHIKSGIKTLNVNISVVLNNINPEHGSQIRDNEFMFNYFKKLATSNEALSSRAAHIYSYLKKL